MEAHSGVRRGGESGGLRFPRSPRLLAALGDERLVEQVRRGNDAAFEVVFDRYHRGILAFCRHMLASSEEAEDAVQHTFIQAYDAIRSDDRELKLKAWLYTIARNRCLSVLRARREQAAELDDVPTAGLSDEVQRRSELRELLADIRTLPEDQRAALVLSEVGDLSHADIATVVGCEPSKVKSLVFQARSSLIESRKAREIPCHEIREQLATASGAALRRAPLRRHVRQCEGCAEFREQVQRQRRMMAVALPVLPSVALKHGALAALGIGGSAAAGAGAGAGAAGLGSLAASSAASKAIVAVALAGAAVGSGIAIDAKVGGAAAGDEAPVQQKAIPADPDAATRDIAPAPARGRRDRGASADRSRGDSRSGGRARGEQRRGGRDAGRGGRGGRDGAPAAQSPSRGNGPPPHAQGTPQSQGPPPTAPPRENVPGTNANGDPLPPTSNGGAGGGNSGRHLGAEKDERSGGPPPGTPAQPPEKTPPSGRGGVLPDG